MENRRCMCPGFMLYWNDMEEYVEVLSEKKLGRIIKAVIRAGCGKGVGEELKHDSERLAFLHIMNTVVDQEAKYRETVARNAERARKRWDRSEATAAPEPQKRGRKKKPGEPENKNAVTESNEINSEMPCFENAVNTVKNDLFYNAYAGACRGMPIKTQTQNNISPAVSPSFTSPCREAAAAEENEVPLHPATTPSAAAQQLPVGAPKAATEEGNGFAPCEGSEAEPPSGEVPAQPAEGEPPLGEVPVKPAEGVQPGGSVSFRSADSDSAAAEENDFPLHPTTTPSAAAQQLPVGAPNIRADKREPPSGEVPAQPAEGEPPLGEVPVKPAEGVQPGGRVSFRSADSDSAAAEENEVPLHPATTPSAAAQQLPVGAPKAATEEGNGFAPCEGSEAEPPSGEVPAQPAEGEPPLGEVPVKPAEGVQPGGSVSFRSADRGSEVAEENEVPLPPATTPSAAAQQLPVGAPKAAAEEGNGPGGSELARKLLGEAARNGNVWSGTPAPAVPKHEPTGEEREAFRKFRQLYPRKWRLAEAEPYFYEALTKISAPELLRKLYNQTFDPNWKREDGRYVPGAWKWLKGECWLDVPPSEADMYAAAGGC